MLLAGSVLLTCKGSNITWLSSTMLTADGRGRSCSHNPGSLLEPESLGDPCSLSGVFETGSGTVSSSSLCRIHDLVPQSVMRDTEVLAINWRSACQQGNHTELNVWRWAKSSCPRQLGSYYCRALWKKKKTERKDERNWNGPKLAMWCLKDVVVVSRLQG